MKSLPFILFVIVLCSCGKQEVQGLSGSSTNLTKSLQAQTSCEAIKFPADIDFNGYFLYHFVRCVSNIDGNGQESLKGMVNVVNSMGIEGLDAVADFMKSNPATKSSAKEEYPLIRAMTTFMDRGAWANGTYDQQKLSERFGSMQVLLENFNPFWSVNLLFEINEAGKLHTFLDSLAQLAERIDEKSLIALSRTYLRDAENRKALVQSVQEIIANDTAWNSLTSLSTLEEGIDSDAISSDECLRNWLDTRVRLDNSKINKYCNLTSDFDQSRTGADRLDDLMNSLNPDESSKIADFGTKLVETLVDRNEAERLTILKRFLSGARNLLMEQEGPLRFATGLLNLAEKTQVVELDSMIEAIKELISNPEVYALLGTNLKAGSSRIHEKIEGFLVEGGPVQGCPGLVVKGLRTEATSKDVSSWLKIVEQYLQPSDQCNYGLSPLASYLLTEISTDVGCVEKDDEISQDIDARRFCLTSSEMKKLAQKLIKQSNKIALVNDNADPTLVKEFVLSELGSVKKLLEKDPFQLRFLHLAPGRVSLDSIDRIREMILNEENLDAAKLAVLDEKISKDNELKHVLFDDFLEKLLAMKVGRLNSVLDDFSSISEPFNDQKLYRILTGIYNNGPFEQIMFSKMYDHEILASVEGDLPKDALRLNEYLSRARINGAIFQNQRLDGMDSRIDYRLIGDRNRSMQFKKGQFQFTRQKPLQLNDYFDFSSSDGFVRFDDLLKNGDMVSKDVRVQDADYFMNFVQGNLFSKMIDSSYWNNVVQTYAQNGFEFESVPGNFLERTKWSTSELRKIALFYSTYFLTIPMFHPQDTETFSYGQSNSVRPQYMTVPVFNELNWTTFLNYYPGFIENSADQVEFSALKQNILGGLTANDYLDIVAQGPFKFSSDANGIYYPDKVSENSLELIKTFAILNLLTINKDKNFVPLVGVGESCWGSGKDQTDCPLTFNDKLDEESGEVIAAYDSLKGFVGDNLLATICPYLAQGQGFSSRFTDQMTALLGITLSAKEMAFCARKNINYYMYDKGIAKTDRIPKFIQEKILTDIISMGKNPSLKKGLSTLASKIRFHKLQRRYEGFFPVTAQSWLDSSGMLSSPMYAYVNKFLSDSKGYFSSRPGFLNVYFNYLHHSVLEITGVRVLENALARYGSRVTPQEHPERGAIYRFVNDFLIGSYERAKDRGDDVLGWLIDMMIEMPKYPEYLEVMTQLASYPSDVETLNIFNNTLVLLIKHLRETAQVNEGMVEFSWQNQGPFLLKQILKQETWWMIADLTRNFSQSEIKGAINTLADMIKILGGNYGEIRPMVDKLIDFTRRQATSILTKSSMVSNLSKGEKDIYDLIQSSWSDSLLGNINKMISVGLKENIGFDGKLAPSLQSQMSRIVLWGMTSMTKLFRDYQSVMSKSRFGKKTSYLKTLLSSLVRPFVEDERSHEGAVFLADFLEDSRLGTWEDLFKPILFQKEYQAKLLKVLSSAYKASLEDYKSLLLEMDQMILKTSNFLKFFINNVRWAHDVTPDTINAVGGIVRFTDRNDLRAAQIGLLSGWLDVARYERNMFLEK